MWLVGRSRGKPVFFSCKYMLMHLSSSSVQGLLFGRLFVGRVSWPHFLPGFTELTPLPILSTIPAPSWPGIKGKTAEVNPFIAWSSVPQIPVDAICIGIKWPRISWFGIFLSFFLFLIWNWLLKFFLHELCHLIPIPMLRGIQGRSYHFQFKDEEREIQRLKMTCPKSHGTCSDLEINLGFLKSTLYIYVIK